MSARANTAAIIVVATATLFLVGFSLDRYGKSARSAGTPACFGNGTVAEICRTDREVFDSWTRHGFSGRTILHVGTHLHFLPIRDAAFFKTSGRDPVHAPEVLQQFETMLTYRNFLWVAAQANIARKIAYVFPSNAFAAKEQVRERNPHVRYSAGEIGFSYGGFPRSVTGTVPEVREPVLLNIDASYFREGDPEKLVADLANSGVRTDLVTLCLSEDDPETTPEDRRKLLRMASRLSVSVRSVREVGTL